MLSIASARYVGGHKIQVSFNNGKSGIADLRDIVFNDKRPIFRPLRNENEFKNFQLDDYTIVWPNELDFAPEFLFFVVFKNAKEFQEQFKKWGYIARKHDIRNQASEVRVSVETEQTH